MAIGRGTKAINPTNMQTDHIVITGPESTGKTTLAQELAHHLDTVWVAEFARYYLQQVGTEYRYDHLSLMLEGQNGLELSNGFHKPAVCDTDWLTYYIWGEDKFGRHEEWWIPKTMENRTYLLCYPDLPWTEDPLREDPNRLGVLFNQYESALQQFQLSYHIIRGVGEQRLINALAAVK